MCGSLVNSIKAAQTQETRDIRYEAFIFAEEEEEGKNSRRSSGGTTNSTKTNTTYRFTYLVATRNTRSFSSSSSESPSSLVLRNKLLLKPSLIDKTKAYANGNITKVSPTPSADEIVLYTNTELNRNGRSFESTCAKKSNENPFLKFVILLRAYYYYYYRVVLVLHNDNEITKSLSSSSLKQGGVCCWLLE